MKKSLLTRINQLLIAALTAGALWSCQDEKPEIIFPDPVIPQKEFKHVETITQDTLTFNEGDSTIFRVRTIPVNLLSRQDVTVQISDTAGAKYQFAEIKSYKLGKDSIWNIVMNMKYGMKSGDIISLMVADEDTVIYSDETVLNMIPREQSTGISLRIMNQESVAAFVDGAKDITVYLRTNPYDLFFGDSASIFITDSLEHSLRKKYTLQDLTFQPADSTWAARINLLEEEPADGYILLKMYTSDTTITSTPVYIRKITITLNSVMMGNNVAMRYADQVETFFYCLPTVTDFSDQKFLFDHNGDKITLGDSVLVEGQFNTINMNNSPVTVTVWKYGAHKDYKMTMYNSHLPVVRINTNGKSVTRRDTWVEGSTMRIELPDGTVDYEGTLSLKGRGNGTWTETNKKPYALRLDEKAKILGMHKQKRWCLLANYKDRTLLRNDAAFWISRHTHMPYTVEGKFVELVWNGKHMGNYYLCEQIRIDNHRVDIAAPNLQDPANGGMLIVIDDFLGYNSSDRYDKSPMVGFRSTGSNSRYKVPYVLKDPDEDENGNLLTSASPTFKYLQSYVKNMEDAIYNEMKPNPNNNTKIKQYLDYDRAIDYVLIMEITMNHDSYNTWPNAGPHSAYMYKDAGGKLCYGPVWDFDYHTFTLYNDAAYGSAGSSENSRIRQWELLKMDNKGNNKYYFADLAKYDKEFRDRLVARWNEYKYVWRDSLPIYIDQMAEYIRLSESSNNTIWAENRNLTNYKQNGDYNLSFQQAVDAMKTAFRKRWDWIDANITKLGN